MSVITGKTNKGLVDFCKKALADNAGYVYGTFGQKCTVALLDDRARAYPDNNLAGGDMRRAGERWLGKRVMDCSGMIKYYLMSKAYGKDPKYRSDVDCGISYEDCTEKGPISTIPEIPGVLVFLPGHVGVYIGGGYCIESQGTLYGVKKTKLAGRGWTKWGKSKFIDYSASSAKVTLKSNGTIYAEGFKDVLGGASKKLKNFKKGDKVTWLEDDGWGWSKVTFDKVTGWLMNGHLKKSGLSEYKTYTLSANTPAIKIVSSKNAGNTTLKKGTKYSLICTIESGTYKGCSYIAIDKARYYIGMKDTTTKPNTPTNTPTATGGMNISDEGVALIKSYEGLSLKACKALPTEQYYTIGYGHYGPDVKANQTITEAEAVKLLKSDLAYFVKGVNSQLKVKVTQAQFDVLVSFAYNCGLGGLEKSKIPEYLNQKKLFKACAQFPVYRHSGGVAVAGLQNRREKELRMFIKGCTFTLTVKMNVREGASTSKKVLKTLAKETKVKVNDTKVNYTPDDSNIEIWCKNTDGWICFKQGTEFFVS